MVGIADEMRQKALQDALKRRSEPTQQAAHAVSDDATGRRSDTATRVATPHATSPATDVATRVASTGVLQRRTQEATVRRAYTVFERQDEVLEYLARELRTDKSDVLRQIVDAWLATQ